GRGNRDLRPKVAEADFGADLPYACDSQHSAAVCRRIHGPAFIAGGGDDEHAACSQLADDRLIRSGARTLAAEAEIDDLRRVGVVGHAGYGESRSPTHRRDDVGVASAAFAHDANGQYPSVPRSAGHTDAIVRLRRDDSRHACTVPGAIRDLAGFEADLGDV